MSIWTHVVGSIRVDGIPGLSGDISDMKKVLGPMCLFEKWNDESTLPRGSEGSLQYQVIEYDSGLPWVVIPIWGDLRDYSDVEEIEKWWCSTLTNLPFIRDAVLRIEVEGRETIILSSEEQAK